LLPLSAPHFLSQSLSYSHKSTSFALMIAICAIFYISLKKSLVRIGCFGRLQIRSKLHLGTKTIWAVYEGVSIDAGSSIIIHGKLLHLKQPQDTCQCAKGLP